MLDVGIYTIFAALTSLGMPLKIDANATFFDNGSDATTKMVFHYKNSKAYLQCSIIEDTPSEAIFTFERGIVRINSRFNGPTSVTVTKNGNENTLCFYTKTHGFNYEIDHFNELVRMNKKESDKMTFKFSEDLIKSLDNVREIIGLHYS